LLVIVASRFSIRKSNISSPRCHASNSEFQSDVRTASTVGRTEKPFHAQIPASELIDSHDIPFGLLGLIASSLSRALLIAGLKGNPEAPSPGAAMLLSMRSLVAWLCRPVPRNESNLRVLDKRRSSWSSTSHVSICF
jgi:hypothetical protein